MEGAMHFTGSIHAPGFELSKRRLAYVDRELSVLEASRVLRMCAAELLVTDPREGNLLPAGVVTARDIVSRVVAAGLDPTVLIADYISRSDPPAATARKPARLQLKETGDGIVLTVVGSAGAVAGMLTLDDMVNALARKPTSLS
jgi:CBS domain-containing protein